MVDLVRGCDNAPGFVIHIVNIAHDSKVIFVENQHGVSKLQVRRIPFSFVHALHELLEGDELPAEMLGPRLGLRQCNRLLSLVGGHQPQVREIIGARNYYLVKVDYRHVVAGRPAVEANRVAKDHDLALPDAVRHPPWFLAHL